MGRRPISEEANGFGAARQPPSSHSNAQRKGCRSRGLLADQPADTALSMERRPISEEANGFGASAAAPFISQQRAEERLVGAGGLLADQPADTAFPLWGDAPSAKKPTASERRGGPPSSHSNAQRKGCAGAGGCLQTNRRIQLFPLWGDAPSAKKPTASERARRPPFISQQRAEERL
ncbi:MAG: hypothetical protein ACLR23_21810 [Clostridia bacterium]